MTLKHVLWATAIWTLVSAIGCGVLIWYIMTHPLPGVRVEKRLEMAGQGAGVVVALGYGATWLPYAAKIGKQRRAARAAREQRR